MSTEESITSITLPSTGFKGSDLPPLVTDAPPHVLIAGAGLAGLFLGNLLEKAGIPYEIFERTAEIKPLGNDHAGSLLFLLTRRVVCILISNDSP